MLIERHFRNSVEYNWNLAYEEWLRSFSRLKFLKTVWCQPDFGCNKILSDGLVGERNFNCYHLNLTQRAEKHSSRKTLQLFDWSSLALHFASRNIETYRLHRWTVVSTSKFTRIYKFLSRELSLFGCNSRDNIPKEKQTYSIFFLSL